MRVGFVCTNFNNAHFTHDAVESLASGSRPDDVRIVVVDNHSREDDVAALVEIGRRFSNVEIVLSPENLGYFRGLNLGIQTLRTSHPDIAHVVIGNNDLTFPSDFVERIQRQAEVLERYAVVAPDIVCADGLHQNPHVLYPISRARRVMWDLYYLAYGPARLIRKLAGITQRLTARLETRHGHELHTTPGPIILGLGACYLLGPEFFRHFDRLYAPTFLMAEEFFLAEQVSAIEQSIYYDPRFVVYHHGAATTGEVPNRRLWAFAKESHRVYKRHLALPFAERRARILRETRDRR